MQRGLLPYIVASQTIPILAIAPMVVVWLGVARPAAVVLGGGHLGLPDVLPGDHQHAARPALGRPAGGGADALVRRGSWSILWRLRVPASLPFLFTALKISAPAAVVGAIIGELPSSIQDGLAGAILNYNQYYVLSPESLWATNIVAAALGIVFFLGVAMAERLIVRRAPENVA